MTRKDVVVGMNTEYTERSAKLVGEEGAYTRQMSMKT
jgi:hypothetical protein